MGAHRELEVGCAVAFGDLSFETAVEAAAKAVASIETQPICCALVFASVKYDLQEVLRGVRSVVGTTPVIGATTAGEISERRHDHSVVVTVWGSRHIVVRTAVGRNVSGDWRRAVADLTTNPMVSEYFRSNPLLWSRLTREGKSVFALLFVPGQTWRQDSRGPEILEALKMSAESKFPIFAAAAADDWNMEENFVLFGEGAFPDSVLLAIFETRLQFGIALDHGFTPSSRTVSVTAVDDREVLTIDGSPAAEELPKLLGSARPTVGKGHLSMMTKRVVGALNGMGEYRVLAATYLTQSGGCRMAQPVTPGTILTAMESKRDSMRLSTSEAVRKAILRGGITNPALVLIGYCALRERFVGGEAVDEEIRLARKLVSKASFFGFLCFGEGGVSDDGVNRYNNATVVSLVLGRDLSAGARVAQEAEKFRLKIERRANELQEKVAKRTAALNEAVASLSESEERFRLAMHGANDGLWDCDLRTNRVYLSPRWKSMLGYDELELAGHLNSWRRLIHPEDKPPAVAKLRRVLAGGAAFEAEYRMLHKDGHYVDILSRAFPVLDENGQVVRLVGTHVDISERKRVERSARQAATVFSSTHEGVVITDINARIVAVNPAFRSITGYDEAELLGERIAILKSGRQDGEFYQNMWRSIEEKDHWQGEIWNRRKNGEIYPEWLTISAIRDDDGKIANYVGVFTDITIIKKSEERLEHLAHHDPLTDLPNRLLLLSWLQQKVERAERGGQIGAVLFVDLDQFKYVNDSLGHAAGDELLKQVANRLRGAISGDDLLARLGGDEFVIVLDGVSSPDDASAFAEKLIRTLSDRAFRVLDDKEVNIGASVGIAIYPLDGRCPHVLLQHADAALYRSKHNGRASYSYYSSKLTEAAAARLDMERRLRRALEKNEFSLYYQPLVSTEDGSIRTVEALIRWRDPEKGLIPPDSFIPLAEEIGFIHALGDWVLRTACTQMKKWLACGSPLEAVAVNLSSHQLHHPDIHDRIAKILKETGLPPCRLEFEITESALLSKSATIQQTMARLTDLGLRFSIDDFGTGYSSFAYLKEFPISQLKIDKSFTQDLDNDATHAQIFSAIVAVARAFELQVVAEGVETAAQLQAVKDHGCDLMQGYFFSPPLPENELAPRLRPILPARAALRLPRRA